MIPVTKLYHISYDDLSTAQKKRINQSKVIASHKKRLLHNKQRQRRGDWSLVVVTEDFPVIIFDWLFTYLIPNAAFVRIQFDPIGRFIIIWTTFESPGQKLFCPNRQHISGNFCKGVKIFHYTRELRLGELLLTFGNFLLVTLFGFVRI